ncbi:MAG: MFS transporter [Oscillospiraceae bacterium]|nr:MFS transporter [Oscillospiraceae bacterium]
MEQTKKSKKVLDIFPWYSGLSRGLLFFTPISTLFLVIARGLSLPQMAMLWVISTLICILLQNSILRIIKKIGNIPSMRIGNLILVLVVLCITFGNYSIIVLGFTLELIGFTFKDMENIVLRNNLIYLNKNEEYIKYRNKAFLVYSIATAIIALVVAYLFNLNYYLPMILCLAFCLLTLFMSFFVTDVKLEKDEKEINRKLDKKILNNRLISGIILSFGIIRACIAMAFANSELLIQYNLQEFFEVTMTVYYFGIIIFSSRVIRIICNMLFNKIHIRFQDKLLYLLPSCLLIALMLLVFSNYAIDNLMIKFVVMGLAYGIIVVMIDAVTAVVEDVVFKNSHSENHQSIITYLSLSYRVFKVIFGLAIALILLNYTLTYVLIFLSILVIIGIAQFKRIYLKIA